MTNFARFVSMLLLRCAKNNNNKNEEGVFSHPFVQINEDLTIVSLP
jgi:hypothetical protein